MKARFKSIPIVINNRNRRTTLEKLIERLEIWGCEDIIVLDNQSTFEPLMEYYQKSPHTILRLKHNFGYLALWEIPSLNSLLKSHYVYTDSDVVPTEACPADVLEVMWRGLERHPDVGKIGLSLKIDDLPLHVPSTERVKNWERPFWTKRRDDVFFEAPVDTTFALYRPKVRGGYWVKALRAAPPYEARHLPWYVNPADRDPEEIYYRESIETKTHWSEQV